MRRGCIAVREMQCDGCHRPIKCGERYLIINGEKGQKQRLCIDCCLNYGYASYKMERSEQIITLFPQD